MDTCLRAFLDRLQREDAEKRAQPQPVPDPILNMFAAEPFDEAGSRELMVEELRANLTNPYYPGADIPVIKGNVEHPSLKGMTVPYVLVRDDIQRAVKPCGLNHKEGTKEYHEFARRVVQKRIEAEKIAIARAKGDAATEKQLLDALLPPEPPKPEPVETPEVYYVADLIPQYMDIRANPYVSARPVPCNQRVTTTTLSPQAALLVLLPTSARARIIPTDLPALTLRGLNPSSA